MSEHDRLAVEIARLDQRIDDLSLVKLRETNRVLRKDIDEIVPWPHAECFISTPAATSISDTTTYFQAAGTFTNSVDGSGFTADDAGLMTYTGIRKRMFHIFSSWSFSSGNVNQDVEVGLLKSGTIVTASIIARRLAVTNDIGSTALHSMITLAPKETVALGIRNTSASNDVTFTLLNFGIMGMPNNMTGITVP